MTQHATSSSNPDALLPQAWKKALTCIRQGAHPDTPLTSLITRDEWSRCMEIMWFGDREWETYLPSRHQLRRHQKPTHPTLLHCLCLTGSSWSLPVMKELLALGASLKNGHPLCVQSVMAMYVCQLYRWGWSGWSKKAMLIDAIALRNEHTFRTLDLVRAHGEPTSSSDTAFEEQCLKAFRQSFVKMCGKTVGEQWASGRGEVNTLMLTPLMVWFDNLKIDLQPLIDSMEHMKDPVLVKNLAGILEVCKDIRSRRWLHNHVQNAQGATQAPPRPKM